MADEKKKDASELNALVAATVAEVLKATLPEMIALSMGAKQHVDAEQAKMAYATREKNREICGTCNLLTSACKGEHLQAVVYPTHLPHKLAKGFQGIFISGVRFMSPNRNTPIAIPKVSDVMTMLAAWCKNEEITHWGHAHFLENAGDGPINVNRVL